MIACAKCGTKDTVNPQDMLCVKCRQGALPVECGCGKPLAGHRFSVRLGYVPCPDQPESEARKPLDLTANARLKGVD